MATPVCLRCLQRSLRPLDTTSSPSYLHRSLFSTSSSLAAQKAKPPARKARSGSSLRLAKKTRTTTGRPPAPGERKAVRKRIVLSNPNAVEVSGLQDLTGDKLVRGASGTLGLETLQCRVLGLDEETVTALQALETFRPTQGWGLFRRPASLVRAETVDLAYDLADIEANPHMDRQVVFGERGSGKSILLLQAQAMALRKGWVVVHFPDGQNLADATTAYRPLKTSSGTIYTQPRYTAKLLSNLAKANESVLSTLRLSQNHQLPIPVPDNMSLARFAQLGARDAELAWPVWQALWAELAAPSQSKANDGVQRPPVLVTLDGLDQIMGMSAYLDQNAKPFHAHDLALVRHFTELLSGQATLASGGMILAATCQSHRPASPTLDHLLARNYAIDHNASIDADKKAGATDHTCSEAAANASGDRSLSVEHQSYLPVPEWPPYSVMDKRVQAALQGVQALKLQGLSKEEARGVMEYYAHSGVLRGSVTDGLVGESWSLAGSGIIGELERGATRFRF